MIVVDTSLALQWVLPEPASAEAEEFLSRGDLIAPDVLLVEAANVLGKKVRHGQIGVEQARKGLRFLVVNVTDLVPKARSGVPCAGVVTSAVASGVRLHVPGLR